MENDIHAMVATPYGSKFVVHDRLETPTGREVDLVSVWIILHGEDRPRLVTAFPG